MQDLLTPTTESAIRLTQTVQKGGCAAKVAATELRKILAKVQFPPAPPELMVGSATFDDAAIYRVSDELALVQTLDFFTPIVDSPKLFGQIAAANALSDVYAMGGTPKTAMAILAFPLATLPTSIAVEVLQGASDTIAESGAALVGGHTIDDDTLKFGLSVTGYVHPAQVWSNAGASEGDLLILTKPLGTGTLTAALKRGEATESDIADGLTSMATLNNVAGLLSDEVRSAITAATDITGFGLVGHALNLARASACTLAINLTSLPRFARAEEFLAAGFLTKAHRTNAEYTQAHTAYTSELGDRAANFSVLKSLIVDPQTSGGLLLAVKADRADELLAQIAVKFTSACAIGRVCRREELALRFV